LKEEVEILGYKIRNLQDKTESVIDQLAKGTQVRARSALVSINDQQPSLGGEQSLFDSIMVPYVRELKQLKS